MPDDRAWKLESLDLAGVGKAPDIEYAFAEDNASFEASPPGGHIRIEAKSDDGRLSRVVLTNTLTAEVFADIDVRQVPTPSIGDPWNDAAVYAGEIGAALYWSMWRMQQIKALQQAKLTGGE